MHEILLIARDLAAPFKTSLFEQEDDIAVHIDRSPHAGPPFTAPDQPARRSKGDAGIVQPIQFRVDIDGRSKE
jgi:hypothetical protein